MKVWEWVRSPGRVRKADESLGQAGRQGEVCREKWTDRPSQLDALSNSVLCWPDELEKASFQKGAWAGVGGRGRS